MRPTRIAAAVAALFFLSDQALAQTTHTWTGATNGNWGTATNWNTGLVPVTGDSLILTGAGTAPNSNNLVGVSLLSIILNPVPGAYIIAGNAIALQSGASITSNDNSIINNAVTLNGPATFTANASFGLSFSLSVSGTGGLTLVSNASGGIGFEAPNSYSGPTTVSGTGDVFVGINGAIPVGSALTVTGRIDFSSASPTIGSLAGSGIVATQNADPRLTVGGNNTSTTFSGVYEDNSGNSQLVKVGTGTLTLTGANTYLGGTTVSGGLINFSNLGNLGSGNVTLDGGGLQWAAGTTTDVSSRLNAVGAGGGTLDTNGNNVTLASAITGSGALTKNGAGTLTLSAANAYTGGTTVNAGTLRAGAANAFGTGPLNIGSGAALDLGAFGLTVGAGSTLGGTGTTIGAVTIANGGVLAPGNSIGTITVNGSLAFNAGSIFRVETDAAGNADRVNVVGAPGTITINGGTVDVQAGAGTYQRNTSYTILTSTGATTGQFAAVTSNLAFLTPSLVYGPNSVMLNLASSATQSYASVAQTPNQTNVASYLNGVAANPGSAAGLIQQLDNLTASQARTAFEGLSGSSHAAGSQIAGVTGRAQSAAIMSRAESGGASSSGSAEFRGVKYARLDVESLGRPMPVMSDASTQLAQASGAGMRKAAAGEAGLWGQVMGTGGNTDSNGNGAGSSYRAGGFTGGYDVMLNNEWMLGGAVGYTPTHWDADMNGASRSHGRIETPMAALYARYESGPWQLRLNGGYADHKFKTTRDITIGAATTTASSTHRGQEWSAAAELEYAIKAGAWQIRPMAGLRYASLRENGFTESGANGLTVDGRRTENTSLMAGARFLLPFTGGNGGWEFRAAYTHLAGDNDSPVSARLAGQPASFTANGTPLKRDALNVGAGVAGTLSKNVSGYADVSYETRGSGQNAYAVTAGLRVSW